MWRGSRAFDDSSSQVQDILEKARQEAKELGAVYMTAIKDALDILPAPSSARSTPRGLTPGPFLTSTMDVKPGHLDHLHVAFAVKQVRLAVDRGTTTRRQ